MTTESTAPVPAYKAAEALEWAEENPEIPVPPDDDEPTEQASTEGKGEQGKGKSESRKGADAKESADHSEVDESDDSDESDGSDPEGGSEEGQDEDDEEGGDTDADESDSEDEVPELDPLITELAKGNEKAEKRVAEIAKGLQKLKSEAKSLKTELEKVKPQAEFLDGWNKALSDPGTVAEAVQTLVARLAAHHGKKPSDLLPIFLQGGQAEAPTPPKLDAYGRALPEWEALGYGSDKEMQLDKGLQAAIAEIQALKTGSEQFAKEREESRKATEFKTKVAEIAPQTIKKLEKLENGWKVTHQMVEKAITELPNWDPVRAVKAVYADELKTHHAKAVSASRPKRGPEMPGEARGKGVTTPPPGRFSAADALQLVDG